MSIPPNWGIGSTPKASSETKSNSSDSGEEENKKEINKGASSSTNLREFFSCYDENNRRSIIHKKDAKMQSFTVEDLNESIRKFDLWKNENKKQKSNKKVKSEKITERIDGDKEDHKNEASMSEMRNELDNQKEVGKSLVTALSSIVEMVSAINEKVNMIKSNSNDHDAPSKNIEKNRVQSQDDNKVKSKEVSNDKKAQVEKVDTDKEISKRENDNKGAIAKTYYAGRTINPLADLEFIGKNNKRNVKEFLETFEQTAEFERIPSEEWMYHLRKCMKETAYDWWCLREFKTYEQSKRELINFFWSVNEQAEFRKKMYLDKYVETNELTMTDYVRKMTRQAKLLEPPMSEIEILMCLRRQFNSQVNWALQEEPDNLEKLCKILDTTERIREEYKKERNYRERPREFNYQSQDRYNDRQRWNRNYYDPDRFGNKPNYRDPDRFKDRRNYRDSDRFGSRPNYEQRDTSQRRYREDDRNKFKRDYKTNVNAKQTNTQGPSRPYMRDDNKNRNTGKDNDKRNFKSMRTEEMLEEFKDFEEKEDREIRLETGLGMNNEKLISTDILAANKAWSAKALIDTGAQISAVSREMIDKIKEQCSGNDLNGRYADRLLAIKIKAFEIKTAGGKIITSRVKYSIRFGLYNDEKEYRIFTHEFYEIKDLTEDIVLGTDFIGRHNLTLSYNDGRMTIEIPQKQGQRAEGKEHGNKLIIKVMRRTGAEVVIYERMNAVENNRH